LADFNSINVPLSAVAADELRDRSRRNYRHPREEAKLLLERTLLRNANRRGGASPPESSRPTAAAAVGR
jgi:hypothetical protein